MSTTDKQSAENPEVIRDLVVLPESETASEDGDRSPTKTERDVTAESLAEADASINPEVEVVRKLVVLEDLSESEEGDRSPTKTERDLD